MTRDEWEDWFRGDHTVAAYSPKKAIARFVGDRGYGPWYQRDALTTVRKMFRPGRLPFWEVYDYLDKRYPPVPVTA